MMTRNDFRGTKWDVSNWSKQQKLDWQERMLGLGYRWYSQGYRIGNLDLAYYFIDHNGKLLYSVLRDSFDSDTGKELVYHDAFPEQPKSNNDFRGTKWDARTWLTTEKATWQLRMFNLGYGWPNGHVLQNLEADFYYIEVDGRILYSKDATHTRKEFFSSTFKDMSYCKNLLLDSQVSENPESNNGYIVWSPSARTNPKMVHESYDEARKECERLTLKTKQRFHVATLSEPCKIKYDVEWG